MIRAIVLGGLAGLAFAGPALADDAAVCRALDGALVVGQDGEYLGKITGPYAPDSIFNKYGTYGSRYQTKSIFNPYGKYGSEYQQYSATNPYTNKPPAIVKGGKVIAYASANRNLAGALNALVIGITCYGYEPEQ